MRATQFSVLATLTQTGPLPVAALAAQLGLERTTLTRNLRPLEARGFVHMKTSEKDQRVHVVKLTSSGRAAAKKALKAWKRAQADVAPILRQWNLEGLLNVQSG